MGIKTRNGTGLWAAISAALIVAAAGCGATQDASGSRVLIGSGTAAAGSGQAPVAVLDAPVRPIAGPVLVSWAVADAESDPVSVFFEVSADDGQTWRPLTPAVALAGHEGTSGLSTTPLGVTHRLGWDPSADLGQVNNLHIQLRASATDGRTPGAATTTASFAVVTLGRQDPDASYDTTRDTLVLSADMNGGFVPYSYHVNHIVHTKIYGDGTVIFVDPAQGLGEIRAGTLTEPEIVALLKQASENGFWGWQQSYRAQMAPTDLPSARITVKLTGGREKAVSSYGGAFSAPTGYMEVYHALHFPALQPQGVATYLRGTITQAELNQGWYFGAEYEKKLDTPLNWVWNHQGAGHGQPVWEQR